MGGYEETVLARDSISRLCLTLPLLFGSCIFSLSASTIEAALEITSDPQAEPFFPIVRDETVKLGTARFGSHRVG
jgi:hypothetical protein